MYSPSAIHRVHEEKPLCPFIFKTNDFAGASQIKVSKITLFFTISPWGDFKIIPFKVNFTISS